MLKYFLLKLKSIHEILQRFLNHIFRQFSIIHVLISKICIDNLWYFRLSNLYNFKICPLRVSFLKIFEKRNIIFLSVLYLFKNTWFHLVWSKIEIFFFEIRSITFLFIWLAIPIVFFWVFKIEFAIDLDLTFGGSI